MSSRLTSARTSPAQPDPRHHSGPLPAAIRALTSPTSPAQLHQRIVAMNEALILGSLRQHELTAAAESANDRLQAEIVERKRAEQALHRAQAQLRDRAGQLEGLVVKRTSQLTATNHRLARSVESIKQGKEKYRRLLGESQAIRVKLTQVTRQILTAQEDERKLISRELHDTVVQTLVAIDVELTALRESRSITVPQMKLKIAHTQRLVETSANAVHRFSRGLRPAVLDDLGLIPALHAYCKNLAARRKLKIHLIAFAGVEALGGDERTTLFRVAQEALVNVVRHAHATLVTVKLAPIAGAIQMEIRDNGRSFEVEKTLQSKASQGLGLVGMKERIEMVAGRVTIESIPGRGTTVRAQIPFVPAQVKK